MTQNIAIFADTVHLKRLYQLILTGQGYHVSFHDENVAGIEDLKQLNPYVIMIDTMTGQRDEDWWLLRQLRAREVTATTPVVIATTGAHLISPDDRFKKDINVLLLSKPFDRATLLDILDRASRASGRRKDDGSNLTYSRCVCNGGR